MKNKRGKRGKTAKNGIFRGAENRRFSCKAQVMGMPFQLIFSLILIAITLFVTIWAINHFMHTMEHAKILDFVNKVNGQAYTLWGKEANLPPVFSFSSKFSKVCFADLSACPDSDEVCKTLKTFGYSEENFFLFGENNKLGIAEEYDTHSAWKITCDGNDCISLKKSPVCYDVGNEKVQMNIAAGAGYGCAAGKVCILELK